MLVLDDVSTSSRSSHCRPDTLLVSPYEGWSLSRILNLADNWPVVTGDFRSLPLPKGDGSSKLRLGEPLCPLRTDSIFTIPVHCILGTPSRRPRTLCTEWRTAYSSYGIHSFRNAPIEVYSRVEYSVILLARLTSKRFYTLLQMGCIKTEGVRTHEQQTHRGALHVVASCQPELHVRYWYRVLQRLKSQRYGCMIGYVLSLRK